MLMEEGIIERYRKTTFSDMGNCFIRDIAFVYEENVVSLSEGDILIEITKTRLEKLIFGK